MGFRLGEHADFQILFELGPQTDTNPIGATDAKRRRDVRIFIILTETCTVMSSQRFSRKNLRSQTGDAERRDEGRVRTISASGGQVSNRT